jgi:hypothetical protein
MLRVLLKVKEVAAARIGGLSAAHRAGSGLTVALPEHADQHRPEHQSLLTLDHSSPKVRRVGVSGLPNAPRAFAPLSSPEPPPGPLRLGGVASLSCLLGMDALGLVCQVLLLGLFVDLLLLGAPALGSWIAASGPSRSLHRHTGSSSWAGMKCTTDAQTRRNRAGLADHRRRHPRGDRSRVRPPFESNLNLVQAPPISATDHAPAASRPNPPGASVPPRQSGGGYRGAR